MQATQQENILEAVTADAGSAITGPTLGAAMPLSALPTYVEWLNAGKRDLEIQDTVFPSFLDDGWQESVAAAAQTLADFQGRIGIHAPFKALTLLAEDPLIADIVLARLRQSLLIGAELGASHMVIHSPFTTFGSPYITHSSKSYKQREMVTVQAMLEKLLPLAEEVRCQLVIENIYDTNPALLIELVSVIDSPYLGLSVDTGHAYLTSLIGGPSPDQWIRETGPWLGHVHLQDTDGLADRHWRIGRGSINWFAVFDALSEVETGPRLILEMRNLDDIALSQGWLAEQGLAG